MDRFAGVFVAALLLTACGPTDTMDSGSSRGVTASLSASGASTGSSGTHRSPTGTAATSSGSMRGSGASHSTAAASNSDTAASSSTGTVTAWASSSSSSSSGAAVPPLVCPAAGAFCGSDGVTGGEADTLYTCPGESEAPSSSTPCASGCTVKPSPTPDVCASPAPVCPGVGAYCGSDGVTGGDADTLYTCPGAGKAPSSSVACASGCDVQPAGTPDTCKVVCPGAGAYCGSDGVSGGDANTLYACPGSGKAPSSSTPCAQGCSVQPAPDPDYCTSSCGGAAGDALDWEASQIAAGIAGNCSGSPPACYSDWCLGFVNAALTHAGLAGMYAPTAAQAGANQRAAGNWTAWGGECPCGAVLFWEGNSCNGGDGHVVICNGDGTASTSGWPGYAGGARASISWLVSMECGNDPAGYAEPH